MAQLKIGLIGCGRAAQAIHLNVLPRLPGVELSALAEIDPRRRAEAQRLAPGARAFSDYREMLGAAPVEAVVICLPPGLHAEAAVAAFEAAKHVYLEKPMAASLDDGRAILQAWRRAGRVGQMGFNYRYNPLVQALRRDLQGGRIGRPGGAQTVFATAGQAGAGWRGTRADGGGALLELASHHIDLARWLLGEEVASVYAAVRSLAAEADCASLAMHMHSGLTVQTLASFGAVEEDALSVYGPQGKLKVDRYRALALDYSPPLARQGVRGRLLKLAEGAKRLPYWRQKRRAAGNEPSYSTALAAFAQAAAGDGPAGPDLLDGWRALAVVAAAEASAREGRRVTVAEVAEPGNG